MANTIFVQIASYRDPQLIPTLNDLIDKAAAPENIVAMVCWQHGDEQTLESFISDGFTVAGKTKSPAYLGDFDVHILNKSGCTIKLMDVHYNKSKGACWARNAIQRHYAEEKYTLQLDSHHRFVQKFDALLIDMLERLRKQSPKPLLTAYMPSFDPERDPMGRSDVPWKMQFDRFIPEGAIFFKPAAIDNWKKLKGKPIRARFYSGHFAFADGTFAVEVQHDPEFFFHGEESSIAARAYTHGYDMYHPTVLILWHEYTRKGRVRVWDDHTTAQKLNGDIEKDWVERNNASLARNRVLFGMDGLDPKSIDFGKYGFGTKRTLLEYEQYAGVSFAYRSVQQETLDGKDPPNSTKYQNEEQWKSTFVRSNDIRICFHKTELGQIEDDYDFWYVGCHDEAGNEIYRKDASAADIKRYILNDFIDFRFVFFNNSKPTSYTVWTHSASKGWLVRIVKPVVEY